MWRELVFTVLRENVDRWSDALIEAGALSVQAMDADADSPDEQAVFGEPGLPAPASIGWEHTTLAALIDAQTDAGTLLVRAADLIDAQVPADLVIRHFDDQDWVRVSQEQFEPIPIGRTLLITPSWHAQPAGETPARLTLVLDPGLAFGTGSHPTTRLCLQWLEENLRPGARVIDYGCGSGILAIAAARLGAGEVIGIDIDPQALAATRNNAAINGVAVTVLATSAPMPDAADVVVANILASPLKVLAPLLGSLVRPGGALVLAGLLKRQIDEVAACYPTIPLQAVATSEGWACLSGRKA